MSKSTIADKSIELAKDLERLAASLQGFAAALREAAEPDPKPTPAPKPDPKPAPPTPAPKPTGESLAFAALDNAKDVVTVDGVIKEKYEAKPKAGRVFDARDAEVITDNIRYGGCTMEGGSKDKGMVWAGGYFHSTRPWDASWDEHKATKEKDDPSRQSAAFSNHATGATVTGVHAFNVHDGLRMNSATDWRVEHCWLEYIRDDGIENDSLAAGTVYDCLFDGVYTGFSTRPGSSNKTSRADGNVLTVEKSLVRLEAQPYPYKWESKSGVLDVEGNEYKKGAGIPYSHGKFFKYEQDDDEIPGRNVHFRLIDNVFLGMHGTDGRKYNFPHPSLLDECRGNIMIWIGPGEYKGDLPDEGVYLVTGNKGRELWAEHVKDWHARHPDVGAARKPKNPGEIVFPRMF